MITADSFRELLFEAHVQFGNRAFLFDDPLLGVVSYSKLLCFSQGIDRTLDELGVPAGAAVATIFNNCGIAALLFLAVIASRRILIPLNPASSEDECDYMLSTSECSLVILDPSHTRASNQKGRRSITVSDHRNFLEEVCGRGDGGITSPAGNRQSEIGIAEIVFTSGSTGRPKGVVLSERNLLSNATAIAEAYAFRTGDRFMTVCPLFHNSGQVFTTLSCVLVGGSTVPIKSDVAMVYFWSHVSKYRPDWSFVMSSLLAVLLADRKTLVPPQARIMRGLGTGGASIDGLMIARFESRFGVPVRTVYGLTETASIATCEPLDPEPRSLGSSGRPLPVCEVRIDPAAMPPTSPAASGTQLRGEIVIRGPTVFSHYIQNADLTHERKRDGWLRTGDVGYFDDNGNLFVVDRLDSMLIVSGENVYPAEIENLCTSLPGAAQIVLAGINHAIWGTELILVYRTIGDITPQIRQWQRTLAERVTGFKLPKRYISLSALGLREFPTTSNGKLDRRKVARLLDAKVHESINSVKPGPTPAS